MCTSRFTPAQQRRLEKKATNEIAMFLNSLCGKFAEPKPKEDSLPPKVFYFDMEAHRGQGDPRKRFIGGCILFGNKTLRFGANDKEAMVESIRDLVSQGYIPITSNLPFLTRVLDLEEAFQEHLQKLDHIDDILSEPEGGDTDE